MADLARLAVNDQDRRIALEIHSRFSKREGSDHIAKLPAIEWMAACLRASQPKTVLEMGPGIGTLTEMMLSFFPSIKRLVATEKDPFCLTQLRKNLSNPSDPRLNIVRDGAELKKLAYTADFILMDGGFYAEEELDTAHAGTVVFVEGNRERLRAQLEVNLGKRGLGIEFTSRVGPRLKPRWRIQFKRGIPWLVANYDKGCYFGVVKSQAQRLSA